MKRIILTLFSLFLMGSVFAQGGRYYDQRVSLFNSLPVTSKDIVFLGNSITDGCEWAELFNNRHVKNRGISGDRMEWLVSRVDSILAGHPKKVFFMMGTNDLSIGWTPQQVLESVRGVVERFRKESPWTKIYIQSVLPVNGREFGVFRDHYRNAAKIVELNELYRRMCDEDAKDKLYFIDLHAKFVDEEGLMDPKYTNDGLHLNGEGYLLWRDQIRPLVK